MSLILEALRKSEAARRRGEVPDLHAAPSQAALRVRDGPPAWWWLGLALAAAVIVAMALWLARRTPPTPSPAVEVPVLATGPAAAHSVDSGGEPAIDAEAIAIVGPSPMPDDRADAVPITASMPRPDRDAGLAPMSAALSPAATPSTRAPAATQAAIPSAPAVSRAPAPPPPAPAVAAALASTGDPVTPVAAAPGSAPLRLSDLAATERQLLPPLKMSMHMWAPTQRFAIIDGTRVSEGDRIGDAVVEEITVDGVVLAWQGQRLQIPTR